MIHDIDHARLCQTIYSAPDDRLTTGDGIHEHFAFGNGTVNGLYTLSFRGSKSRLDWIADLFAFPAFDIHTARHALLGPLHGGFLIGALSLYPQVRAAVAGRPYALCGHSLGGALATLLAAMLALDGHPAVETVTFGAPRVGMDPFARACDRLTIRQYRYGNDLVPMVPTHPPFIHASERLINVGHALKGLWPDHHITAYLGALEKHYATEPAGTPALAG